MSVFEHLRRTPVRKNITMTAYTSEALEKLSALSGVTQGEIIEKAFGYYKMRMLTALVTSLHPVADALDIYLANVADPSEDARLGFLRMFLDLSERVRFRGGFVALEVAVQGGERVWSAPESACEMVNGYVASHISDAARRASETLDRIADMAGRGVFVSANQDATRENIVSYINALRAGTRVPELCDADLYKILVVLFRDFAYPVEQDLTPGDGDPRAYQYGVFILHRETLGI